MRVTASQPTTHSGLFAAKSAMRVPLPAPLANRPRAKVADARSTSLKDSRASSSTTKVLSPYFFAACLISSPEVGVNDGNDTSRFIDTNVRSTESAGGRAQLPPGVV